MLENGGPGVGVGLGAGVGFCGLGSPVEAGRGIGVGVACAWAIWGAVTKAKMAKKTAIGKRSMSRALVRRVAFPYAFVIRNVFVVRPPLAEGDHPAHHHKKQDDDV